VRVRLVVPGRSLETPFAANARPRMQGGIPEAYASFAQSVFARMTATHGAEGQPPLLTRAVDVAEAVWHAVNDPSSPGRIPAGADAVALAASV
jgi:hypothetical protein